MDSKMTEDQVIQHFDKALQNGDIYLLYQPQFNHSTKRMIGAEALMRWKDPEFGVQYPSDFVPILERCGLISRADLQGFEILCRYLRECLDANVPLVPVSFNLSRYDIYQYNFPDELERIRAKYDIPVKYLRAEITESTAIAGMTLVRSFLDRLHASGYIVEMDDFGSGYSSLNMLKDMPVDVLKLDMRFLSKSSDEKRAQTIIRNIIHLSEELSIDSLTEGVETQEQYKSLSEMGCKLFQGYYFAKPMPVEDFIEFVNERKKNKK